VHATVSGAFVSIAEAGGMPGADATKTPLTPYGTIAVTAAGPEPTVYVCGSTEIVVGSAEILKTTPWGAPEMSTVNAVPAGPGAAVGSTVAVNWIGLLLTGMAPDVVPKPETTTKPWVPYGTSAKAVAVPLSVVTNVEGLIAIEAGSAVTVNVRPATAGDVMMGTFTVVPLGPFTPVEGVTVTLASTPESKETGPASIPSMPVVGAGIDCSQPKPIVLHALAATKMRWVGLRRSVPSAFGRYERPPTAM